MNNILLNTSSVVVLGSTAAGSGALTQATLIDLQGFEIVVLDFLIGTLTSGQTKGVIQINAGVASNGSDQAALAGAAITVQDGDTAKVESIEVVKPTNMRYIGFTFTRNSQACQVLSVVARKYAAHKGPVNDDLESSGTIAQSLTVIDPEYSNSQLTTVTAAYGNTTKQVCTTYRNAS